MEGEWEYFVDLEPEDVCWLCGGKLDRWSFCEADCLSAALAHEQGR